MRVVLSAPEVRKVSFIRSAWGCSMKDEVPVLETACRKSANGATPRTTIPMQFVDIEFHVDRFRMGKVRTGIRSRLCAGCATDFPRFPLKQFWELPTIFLPSDDISTLERTVKQVNARFGLSAVGD